MLTIIKKGTMPNGVQIQIQLEDWGSHLAIAAYPTAVRDSGLFIHKGEQVRLTMNYDADTAKKLVLQDYDDLINGVKNLESMADRFDRGDIDRWILGMAIEGCPREEKRAAPTIEERAKKLLTIEAQDALLEELWARFGDIPMDPETETMEEDFLDFPHGTHREDIWHWFDERYSKGVAHLLMSCDGVDRTDQTAKMVYLNQLCFECETEGCVYNHDGECRYALIHEKKPVITEEDGCKSGEIPL